MSQNLVIPKALWHVTWAGLQARCDRRHEAACIWGGIRTATEDLAKSVVFLDDLPGTKANRLSHRTPPEATAMLFGILRNRGECIVGDVHAHPENWVGQSRTDREHPIEYRVGLWALILPTFATGAERLDRVGVHQYLGDLQWVSLSTSEAQQHLRFTGE